MTDPYRTWQDAVHIEVSRTKTYQNSFSLFLAPCPVNYNMMDTLHGAKYAKMSITHFIQWAGRTYDPF